MATYFTSKQYAEENPDVVKRFVTAMQQSLDYAQSNPDAVREILAEYTQIPPEAAANIKLPQWRQDITPRHGRAALAAQPRVRPHRVRARPERADRRLTTATIPAAASAQAARMSHAAVELLAIREQSVASGPVTVPANRPAIITPTAQAGAPGARATTAEVSAPGHAQPTAPATSAPATTAAGVPAISSTRAPASASTSRRPAAAGAAGAVEREAEDHAAGGGGEAEPGQQQAGAAPSSMPESTA